MIIWRSPSNIALIKYWGKRGFQLPMNPSMSFTLSNSYTETSIEFARNDTNPPELTFEFYFEGEKNQVFESKISRFLLKVFPHFPALLGYHIKINSANSFPHSSGIASSASSMSALALCLCSAELEIAGETTGFKSFSDKAAYISRIGSGSACRSVYGGLVSWGFTTRFEGSSDEFSMPVPIGIHETFSELCDVVLIISSKQKKVSSSLGHSLMEQNPFSSSRYKQAIVHYNELVEALESGNEKVFIRIVEDEALSLHAMFMTSSPGYFLMEPGTLKIIEKIRQFREETGLLICFTLDAGPNIHLLYFQENELDVKAFIERDLLDFCEKGKWIDDRIGKGPEKLGR